ncbi:hypothetical protein [Roseovarius sp.]|uniref:hypothetical protein n=1 Tax=Roseovarius sp. TaxID=1486281 RepID=UPI003A96DFAA
MRYSGLTYDTATGMITGYIEADVATVMANVSPERGFLAGTLADPETHYVAFDPIRLEPRPQVPVPASPQPVGWTYTLVDLPLGSVVTARNEAGDALEITDLSEPLTLVDAGTYRLTVAPPFPWLGFEIDMGVTNA